jgi:ubiquinone/menaquinone biosynthesis C-methylase UbiE
VTGMDFASYMISLAKQCAIQRNSSVAFIKADIFVRDLAQERFDLFTCFDSISNGGIGNEQCIES